MNIDLEDQEIQERKTIEFLYDFYKQSYNLQLNDWKDIEQKIKLTLALYSIFIAIFLRSDPGSKPLFLCIFLTLWFFILMAGLYLLLHALLIRYVEKLPDILNDDLFFTRDTTENISDIVSRIKRILVNNKKVLDQKAESLSLALNIFLPLSLLFLLIYLFINIWTGWASI